MSKHWLLIKRLRITLIVGATVMLANLVRAEADKVEFVDTIKGNLHHPNVLFIVPWQTPSEKIPASRKMAIRLPDYLTQPIERAEFVEQVVIPQKNK